MHEWVGVGSVRDVRYGPYTSDLKVEVTVFEGLPSSFENSSYRVSLRSVFSRRGGWGSGDQIMGGTMHVSTSKPPLKG